jgi:hypothetical protein
MLSAGYNQHYMQALQLSRQLAVEERRQADAQVSKLFCTNQLPVRWATYAVFDRVSLQLAEDARLARELADMLEAKATEAEAADAAYAHALQSAEATALISRINNISTTWYERHHMNEPHPNVVANIYGLQEGAGHYREECRGRYCNLHEATVPGCKDSAGAV